MQDGILYKVHKMELGDNTKLFITHKKKLTGEGVLAILNLLGSRRAALFLLKNVGKILPGVIK